MGITLIVAFFVLTVAAQTETKACSGSGSGVRLPAILREGQRCASPPRGPYSVSQSFPVTGWKSNHCGFRWPSLQIEPSAPGPASGTT